MFDKYGYLMKAEAEEHMVEELSEAKEKLSSLEPWMPSRFRAIFEVQDRVLRSWGGCSRGNTLKIR